ncbi:MAG: tRNA threonylcarbamoyladenosine dehydratase [Chromatiales bacterium]|nr:tRNA threonylcarbamoyladenosine dehydratase [Chromatiales bacterium]
MEHPQIRTELLVGKQGLEELAGSRILVVGLGGVGAYAAESLARGGVGRMTIVDHDLVSISNLNRQLCALRSTLGRPKARVMAERLLDINPLLDLTVLDQFIMPDEAPGLIRRGGYDFVADCIDTVASKAALIAAARQVGVPLISSLGAGNRLDPAQVKFGYLDETTGDGVARALCKQLRPLGVDLHVPAIYSTEPSRAPAESAIAQDEINGSMGRAVNGSISYLPAIFGLTMSGAIIRSLLGFTLPR